MIGLAAVALLASCEDKDKNVEIDPYATNFVYLKAPLSSTYRATFSTGGTWKIKPDEVVEFMQVRCTKPAPQDIEVTVSIDESMVESYNALNDSEYQFLSEAELFQEKLVIKKGQYVSEDTIKLRHTNIDAMLEAGTQSYMIPVKITSVSSGTMSESGSFNIFYEASMLFAEITNTYTGVKITDRTGWKIYKDQIGGKDITSTLTDGSNYTDVYGSDYKGTVVLYIDLGKQCDNITNVGVEHYANQGSYAATEMQVEVSTDNVQYKSLGTYRTSGYGTAVLDLYEPQSARYIRITGYDPTSSYGWDIGEINVATAQ